MLEGSFVHLVCQLQYSHSIFFFTCFNLMSCLAHPTIMHLMTISMSYLVNFIMNIFELKVCQYLDSAEMLNHLIASNMKLVSIADSSFVRLISIIDFACICWNQWCHPSFRHRLLDSQTIMNLSKYMCCSIGIVCINFLWFLRCLVGKLVYKSSGFNVYHASCKL